MRSPSTLGGPSLLGRTSIALPETACPNKPQRKFKEWSPIDRMLASKGGQRRLSAPDLPPLLWQANAATQTTSWAALSSQAIAFEQARADALEKELTSQKAVRKAPDEQMLGDSEQKRLALEAELETLRRAVVEAAAAHAEERRLWERERRGWLEEQAVLKEEVARAFGLYRELEERSKDVGDNQGKRAPKEDAEVPDLDDFARSVCEELRLLGEGQQRDFPPDLSERHRVVVHRIASELGFHSTESHQDGAASYVSVANFSSFEQRTNGKVQKSHTSRMPLVAEKQCVDSEAINNGAEQCVTNARQPLQPTYAGAGAGQEPPQWDLSMPTSSADDAKGGSATPVRRTESVASQGDASQSKTQASPQDGESQAQHMHSLFHTFATGEYKGQQIFLRCPDLKRFSEQMKHKLPNASRIFSRYETALDKVFSETLQLQIDMDLRTSKGLTLRWFQVFVQKAVNTIGMSVGSFLTALSRART